MSHFLYIHKDLSNVAGVWKVGVAMTPYSAVRARQKFCWNKFHLDYLYFGLPWHVKFLEKTIKKGIVFELSKNRCVFGIFSDQGLFPTLA